MAGLEVTGPEGVTLHRMDVDEFITFCESAPWEIAMSAGPLEA